MTWIENLQSGESLLFQVLFSELLILVNGIGNEAELLHKKGIIYFGELTWD